MINLVEKALLLNLSLFLIFSFYSKILSKVFLINGIFFLLLINILKNKSKFYRYLIPDTPLGKNLLVFFIAAILSTVFSLNPYHSQKILFNRYLLYIFSICLGFFISRPKNNLNILLGAFISGGIIIGMGGLLDYLRTRSGRLFTSYGMSIDISFYLTMSIPLSFMILFFVKNKLLKIGAFFTLLSLLPCFVWNSSRAAWIAVVFSTLFIVFLRKRVLALILVAILIIIILFLPQNEKDRITSITRTTVLADRPAMWKAALNIFKDHPVFGAGPGMYEKLFDKYYAAPEGYKGYTYLHAHNTYLELMAEMGVVGLLAFLGIFAVFLKYAFKTIISTSGDKQAIILGLTGTVIGILILCTTGTVIIVGLNTSALFWFLFGIAVSLSSQGNGLQLGL
jgi:O-antigen ligase